MQPECADYMEYVEQPQPEPLPSRSLLPGEWMWIAIFTAVIIFEAWAIWTHHYTMSETVWYGPRWFRWALGIGFLGLLFHLFLQR
jgi:hypothetical protein